MMPIRIRIRVAILMPIQIRVWISDLHQNNNADLNADPSPSFAHFGKLGLIFLFLFYSIGRLKYILNAGGRLSGGARDFQTKPTQPNIFNQEKRILKEENEYLNKKNEC